MDTLTYVAEHALEDLRSDDDTIGEIVCVPSDGHNTLFGLISKLISESSNLSRGAFKTERVAFPDGRRVYLMKKTKGTTAQL